MTRIKRFGIVQTAKIAGIIYFLFTAVIFIPFGLLASLFSVAEYSGLGFLFSGVFVFLIPFLYGAVGFITTAIFCLIYNLIAGWIGGIEIEVEMVGEIEDNVAY